MKNLAQIFTEVFPEGGPVEQMKYQETTGWDSLNHMVLCAQIEENFDVILEIADIANMSSFDKAKEIVNRCLHG
jgi:acyl carrier protein